MIPDVNVLVAASRADHPHHETARSWLLRAMDACAAGQTLEILPMVASGFLRLVTHPKIFVKPTPVEEAVAFLRALLKIPGVEVTSLGPEWPAFLRLCEQKNLGGNDIPDAWIAAAVHDCDGHLVTFDQGFRRLLSKNQVTILIA